MELREKQFKPIGIQDGLALVVVSLAFVGAGMLVWALVSPINPKNLSSDSRERYYEIIRRQNELNIELKLNDGNQICRAQEKKLRK